MDLSVSDELYARAIGWEVLQWLRREHPEVLPRQVEGDAVRVLEKIKTVLNDDTLSDPDCFHRIERIAETFSAYGLRTSRHDWG